MVFRAGAHHLLRMALNKPFSLPQHLSLKYWLSKRQATKPELGITENPFLLKEEELSGCGIE